MSKLDEEATRLYLRGAHSLEEAYHEAEARERMRKDGMTQEMIDLFFGRGV